MIYKLISSLVPTRVAKLFIASVIVAAWGFLLGLVAVVTGVSQISAIVIACGLTVAVTGGISTVATRGMHAPILHDAALLDAAIGFAGALALAAILQFYGV